MAIKLVGQLQRRAGPRLAAVREHVRDRDPVRALRAAGGRPGRRRDPRGMGQPMNAVGQRLTSTSRSSWAFVVVTLVVVYRTVARQPHGVGLLRRRRDITGTQNGVAIAGDYLSAASFLGIAGAIALNGYDGFLYSIGFLVAWLVALLLVAELLRNTGKFTMGDVLAFRMRQRPVRAAAAISTLVVSLFYLLAQMAGAGGLVALLLGVERQVGAGRRHRGRRRADDRVRAGRRHEGHHLRPDHQGGAAPPRRRGDDHLGARLSRLRPLRAARRPPRPAARASGCWRRACST